MKNISFSQTIDLMKADYLHWIMQHRKERNIKSFLSFLFLPGSMATGLYRIGHFFAAKKLRFISRSFQLLAIALFSVDINPDSEIGGGFLLFHTVGTIITGKIGENVIVSALIGIGGDGSGKDVGAGPGLPVIGDKVQVGAGVMILGPVVIGNNAKIAVRAGVFKDVPEGALAAGSPARIVKQKAPDGDIFDRK